MKVEEVFNLLEREVAPVSLSDEFAQSTSFTTTAVIIVNCGGEVKSALFSLDLSEKAVKKAVKLGYNLIVTHHPAIYGGISRLDLTRDPLSKSLATCMERVFR